MTVCPDASGVVVLKLETDIESSASGEAGFSAHSSMEQRGQVGDDAWLASGSESEQIDVTTTTPGGSPQRGTLQRTLTTSAGPQGSFGSVTGGTGQTSGSAHAFGLAQQKWRDGACVEIRATESSREVAPNEVVPFTATPRHKIEGVDLDKRVVATLTGRLAVDPAGVEQDPPAAVTYTAPSEVDDGGTVTLKSTSNRGIGTLDLTFVVKVRDWSIDEPSGGGRITGQKCGGVGGDWIVDGTYRRAVGPMVADGKQRWVITINEATMAGTYRYTDAQRSTVGGVVIKVDTTIKGTVTLTIDDTGRARMVLTETSRKITASTNLGGSGGGAGQPDLVGRLVWQVGGDC
jgi:hypothetical protein